MLLADRTWPEALSPEDGDLVERFWVPALARAVRYDRLTGYFSAGALLLAARGLEALVRNHGRMRLLVGCTLEPPEIEAILRGEELARVVERHLAAFPLEPRGADEQAALELLAWMVARGILEVRVVVPCDAERRPVPDPGLFHAKSGILEDKAGNRLAFTGSINETPQGWTRNFERFHVFTSWGPSRSHLEHEERAFAELWENRAQRAITLDVPEAVRAGLLRWAPPESVLPARLREAAPPPPPRTGCAEGGGEPLRGEGRPAVGPSPRELVWSYIAHAPHLPNGKWLGLATAPVRPWPHQLRAFERMWDRWPPRLLIADEVGLGKTIQAGALLRQAWLSGRAKRILVLAPSAVLRQWQLELREKFNLAWPIYDGQKLIWPVSPALQWRDREVGREGWCAEPCLLASSHLVRRLDRARELLAAEPPDLLVVDEAHHARRRGAGGPLEEGPNRLLALLRELAPKVPGLVLLTATPMQIHPIEVFDLLALLGLPAEWDAAAFQGFFEMLAAPGLSNEALDRLARLFQAVERWDGQIGEAEARSAVARAGLEIRPLPLRRVLEALRDTASTPRRMLREEERAAARAILVASSPVARRISRNTRALLRRYKAEGRLRQTIAQRRVEDRFVEATPEERALGEALERYIAELWQKVKGPERTAVGFVLTIYRRRLASSTAALVRTLEKRLEGVSDLTEKEVEEEAEEAGLEPEELDRAERVEALLEEREALQDLLHRARAVRSDSKARALLAVLGELAGLGQVMVFSQYTDTMDFLREFLARHLGEPILCFSGRGGEIADSHGGWRTIDRDRVKALFAEGKARLLLCTDAAAEGLNFQFCGAVVNYDLPWNPMRVEQRIGRIDRLGQRHEVIRIVNLFVADTVEAEVYRALRERVGLFENVVGPLQPILARLPRRLEEAALAGAQRQRELVAELERDVAEARAGGLDLDQLTSGGVAGDEIPEPPYGLAELARLLDRPDLLPESIRISPAGPRDRRLQAPGPSPVVRVTADPEHFDAHAESVELFAPGSPVFPELRPVPTVAPPDRATFQRLLAHPGADRGSS